MPPRLQTSGDGRGDAPCLPGAINATSRIVEAMGSASESREDDASRGGEGSSGTGRRILNPPTPSPPYSHTDNSSTLPPVERYARADGKIGVVISQGYHGGWSTKLRVLLDPRASDSAKRTRRMEEMALFDKDIVAAVLEGHMLQARTIAIAKMGLPKHFSSDYVELIVVWVAPGDEFEVAYAPGFEHVRLKNFIEYWRA